MSEKKSEKKEVEEKKEQQTPRGALAKLASSPSEEQIEQWKATHGDIYVTGFSDTEMFVWRTINRAEYLALQEKVATQGMSEAQSEELLCDTCLLWPTQMSWATGKGGTPTTLSEQIMQRSHFLSGMTANMIVAKL